MGVGHGESKGWPYLRWGQGYEISELGVSLYFILLVSLSLRRQKYSGFFVWSAYLGLSFGQEGQGSLSMVIKKGTFVFQKVTKNLSEMSLSSLL